MDSYIWTHLCWQNSKDFYIHKLCADTTCSLEDLSRVMNDTDVLQKRASERELSSQLDDDDILNFFTMLNSK